ncbi:MAG: hypothetical protein AB7V16_10245 [Vulcanibacillus sp.]
MGLNKREVVIDADFFNKFTEKDPSGVLFLMIMDEMNTMPVMHEYVYSDELMGNITTAGLVKMGHIKIYKYQDYINKNNETDYKEKFRRAYKDFNYEDFAGDVFTYRQCQQSLGEIRSTLMAWYMNIGIFMSDDGGAKQYIETKLNSAKRRINVYNVYDTLHQIALKDTRNVKWTDIKATAKSSFEFSLDKYTEIRNLWCKQK